jgi:hypothetical protein
MLRRTSLCLLAAALVPAIAAAQAAPSAQVLGVPVYPGATYDARNSAGMSQEREKYYIFTTADDLAQVVAFYERATQKRGTAMGEGAVLIAIEGRAPFPRHGVMIERSRPGMYPPAVRTVITVRRELPEEEGEPERS